ncbi:hypothetical protein LJB75_00320 [Bacteroidales bacterium OttesenSCG-928-L19]|nr:hypothetical protein [Bacteroidales bacterium OttesenSCG-928-L19]
MSSAPQQSSRTFVPPPTGAVKKSISIKENLVDSVKEEVAKNEMAKEEEMKEEGMKEEGMKEEGMKEEGEVKEVEGDVKEAEEVEEVKEVKEEEEEKKEGIVEANEQMDFAAHWLQMTDLIFDKLPTVYYTIKEFVPEVIDQKVYVKVKNAFQKEQIELKKREILSYLRNNFDPEINDIELLVDETIQSKAKIFDGQEKLKSLHEENKSLSDFLKILNLTQKE